MLRGVSYVQFNGNSLPKRGQKSLKSAASQWAWGAKKWHFVVVWQLCSMLPPCWRPNKITINSGIKYWERKSWSKSWSVLCTKKLAIVQVFDLISHNFQGQTMSGDRQSPWQWKWENILTIEIRNLIWLCLIPFALGLILSFMQKPGKWMKNWFFAPHFYLDIRMQSASDKNSSK